VGIAYTTAFNKTSFPACDRKEHFQFSSRVDTFSVMSLKVCFLDLPTNVGSPK
jgi:hypothetical protein